MEALLGSPTSSRVRAYISFKKECIREIIALLSPVTTELGRSLMEAEKLNPKHGSGLQLIAEALCIAGQPAAYPTETTRLNKPSEAAIARVKQLLEIYRMDHGLEFLDAHPTSRYVQNEAVWGFKLELSCPRWSELFSDRSGDKTTLVINLEVDEAGLNLASVPDAEYLELLDQVALRSSASASWLCYPPAPRPTKADNGSLSQAGGRIATYAEWKHTMRERIEEVIFPFVRHLSKKLFDGYQKVSEDDWDIDELYYALTKGIPTCTSFEHLVGEPHEAMVEECGSILEHFKANTGFELASVDADFDSVQSWSCTMRFRCTPWRQRFEAAIGCEADLFIEVLLMDGQCAFSIPMLKFLEVADLVTFATVTDAYLEGPKTWLALQDDAGGDL